MVYKNINQVQNVYYQELANSLGISISSLIFFTGLIAIWTLVWKGLALWKSAGKKQPIWFVILLVVNTLGILEILYLFIFSKMGKNKKEKKKKTNSKSKSKSKSQKELKRFINKNSLR